MNYFFALELPEEVKQQIAVIADNWRGELPASDSYVWKEPTHYDIPIGLLDAYKDFSHNRERRLARAIARVIANRPTIRIVLTSAAASPNQDNPLAFVATIEPNEAWKSFLSELDVSLVQARFPPNRTMTEPGVTFAYYPFFGNGDPFGTLPDKPIKIVFVVDYVILERGINDEQSQVLGKGSAVVKRFRFGKHMRSTRLPRIK